jgi:hypothetical protein
MRLNFRRCFHRSSLLVKHTTHRKETPVVAIMILNNVGKEVVGVVMYLVIPMGVRTIP